MKVNRIQNRRRQIKQEKKAAVQRVSSLIFNIMKAVAKRKIFICVFKELRVAADLHFSGSLY